MNYPLFTPMSGRVTGEVECLVAAAAGLADNCNKAGLDLVQELTRQFDAVVEKAKASPETVEVRDVASFVYYATMAKLGHGVGLNDDPEQWGPRAIAYARTELAPAVGELAAWIEANLDAAASGYVLTVRATVSAVTRSSAKQGEPALSFSIPAQHNEACDWIAWLAGAGKSTKAEAEINVAEYTALDFTRLLDALDAGREGDVWKVVADVNELMAANRFVLPRLASGRQVISATLTLSVVKVVCPNDGDITDEKRITAEEIEAGRDSNYVMPE